MTRRKNHFRFKLLLDEMFPRREKFPLSNNYFNLRHLVHDFKKQGITDFEVAKFAQSEKRIIITKNVHDFRKICRELKVDLIGISDLSNIEKMDKQITAYLKKRRIHKMSGRYKRFEK